MRKVQQIVLLAALSATPLSSLFAHAGSHAMTTTEIVAHFLSSPFHIAVVALIAGLLSTLAWKLITHRKYKEHL